jgi:hypothetical protein
MKQLLLLGAALGLSLIINAQTLESVDWGTTSSLQDKTSYQAAVGFDSDSYYFVRTDHPVSLNRSKVWLDVVSSLTNTIETSSEIMLPTVGGVQTEYEALFYRQKKLVLFSTARDKARNQLVLYVSYIKPDGSVSNKPKELAAVPLSNMPEDRFRITLSKDESQIVILSYKTFKKYNGDKLNIVVLDYSLTEVFKNDIILGDQFNTREVIITQEMLVNGKFLFLAKIEEKTTKKGATSTNYDFYQFVYNLEKKSLHPFSIEMPKFEVADAKFTINKKGLIVVGGFVKGKNVKFPNEKQGMFFKLYDPNKLVVLPDADPKAFFQKFDKDMLAALADVKNGETPDIRYAYGVNSVEELANGGYIIMTEQKWADDHTVTEASSKESTSILYYHYNNILAGGVNKEGKFEWMKIYPKIQNSTNDFGYYSSYKLVKVDNKLKIFYNDHPDNLTNAELKKVKEFTNNVRTKPAGVSGVLTIYTDGSFERDPMFPNDNKVVIIPQTFGKNGIDYGVAVVVGNKIKFGSFVVQ